MLFDDAAVVSDLLTPVTRPLISYLIPPSDTVG